MVIVKKGHLSKFFKLLIHHNSSIPYTKKASKAFVWLVYYRYLMSKGFVSFIHCTHLMSLGFV